MYIPRAFAETRPELLAQFIRDHSFGTLITTDSQSGLCASHLPFFLSLGESGGAITLASHVARQNEQWRALRPDAEVLAIFQGPHAYISPRWYDTRIAVPTWNYTAVHAYGRPRLIEDPLEIRQLLSHTVSTFEGDAAGAWRESELSPSAFEKFVSGIVAFAIEVIRLEGKFKLNQNRSAADRQGVVAALDAQKNENANAVADLMRPYLRKAPDSR